jgi:KDO2-lipid IV(A) lauroyltransferase
VGTVSLRWPPRGLPARPADAITYLAYRAGSGLAQAIPDRMAQPAGTLTGKMMGRAMKGRRQMLTRHVRRIHGPALNDDGLRRAVDAAFQSYGRYWMEAFRLPRALDGLGDNFTIDGLDKVDAALAEGKGLIFALPHLGNWDAGGARMAKLGYQVTAVVEPLDPPELFEWFADYRRSLGIEIVPLGDGAAVAILAALRANRIVCLVCDRDLGGSGVEVDFFGERTTLPGGPVTLALRSGAPILPVAVYFSEGGHFALAREPIMPDRQGRLRDDVARLTQVLAIELEFLIRRRPDQWHLLQPNWPSDYQPEENPPLSPRSGRARLRRATLGRSRRSE